MDLNKKPKSKSNKTIYIIAGVVVVLVVALFGLKKAGVIGKKQTKKVQIAEVKPVTIVEKVSASGKVQPVDEVNISPEVSGEIKELLVEEGDSVKAGQLLARIRPDNLQSALERTKAALNTQRANLAQSKARMAQTKAQFIRAKQDFERNKKLHDQKVISDSDFETIKANYEVAKADLEASKQSVEAARYTVLSAEASVKEAGENLQLTSIFAPMTGIITRLAVEKGEKVVGTQQMAGTEMLRIANLNVMEVRVDVNENDIIRVSLGDTAIIDVDAYSYRDLKFKGIVTAIANSANETAGISESVTEFEVKIEILNSSYSELLNERKSSPFRPGMTASVDVITERKDNVLSVPLSSVTTREDKDKSRKGGKGRDGDEKDNSKIDDDEIKEVVFVLQEDGKVKLVEVKTGISDFDNIEILSGVTAGEKIVEGPFIMVSKKLKDGDRVEEAKKRSKKNKEEGSEEE